MPFNKIKSSSAAQQVIQQVIKALKEGEYAVGDRLPAERQLAEMLGISRPTVREAFTALAALGILEMRVGSGTYVRADVVSNEINTRAAELLSTDQNHFHALEARLHIEPDAAMLAAERIDDNELELLHNYIVKTKTNPTMEPLFGDDDKHFHMIIAQASKNPLITHMSTLALEAWFTKPSKPWEEVMRAILLAPGRMEVYLQQTEDIYKALEANDPNAAFETARLHVQSTHEDFLRLPTWHHANGSSSAAA